jgi:hypothetical protein
MKKQQCTVCGATNATKSPNGVYIVYEDGHYEPFNGENSKENVKYVGIVHDGHAFCVALKDLGEFPLVKDIRKCPDESDLYVRRECDALNDWEYVERTKHIQEVGTDIPLEEGEYLPSLPMLVAMCYWAERGLNAALEYVGGEPLRMDEYYWSATEYGSTYAWGVYFGSGSVGYYTKCSGCVARAVAAFNL